MQSPPSARVPAPRSRLVERRIAASASPRSSQRLRAQVPLLTVRRVRPTVTGLPSESGTASFETRSSLKGHCGERQVMCSAEPELTTNVWSPSCMWTRRAPSGGSERVNRTRASRGAAAPGAQATVRRQPSGGQLVLDQHAEAWLATLVEGVVASGRLGRPSRDRGLGPGAVEQEVTVDAVQLAIGSELDLRSPVGVGRAGSSSRTSRSMEAFQ